MLQGAAASGTLSADEFMSALHGLTPEEWTRVGEAARRYGCSCSTDGDELLNEAIVRTEDGRRHCPRDVHPVAFLIMTIRSIANEVYEDGKCSIGLEDATVRDARGKVVPFKPEDKRPDPEAHFAQTKFEGEFRSAILGLFADDSVARDLADGMMEGLEGEDLLTLVDLSPVAFASKRRLVRRRIDKAYPNGWKS